jgi:SAM-dependent methyltransferase
MSTQDSQYTERLLRHESVWWKRLLDVQAPYRWNLRRLQPGFVLDVGCGIGRNLLNLGGHGVGVDHNPQSVALARQRGVCAYTPDDFLASPHAIGTPFDSLLISHVLEHMTQEQARALISHYSSWLRPGGQLIAICPQEAGFRSDPTHVEFLQFPQLQGLMADAGLRPQRAYSFPLPRLAGRWFTHNESVVVGIK